MVSAWDDLIDAFATWNFYPSGDDPLSFVGKIVTKKFSAVDIKLKFRDKSCTDFPKAFFCESRMKQLYRQIPHVNDEKSALEYGDVCYIQQGTLVFDALRSMDMVESIIEMISRVLDAPKEKYAQDFGDEILAYWPPVEMLETFSEKGKNFTNVKIEGHDSILCYLFPLSGNLNFGEFHFPFENRIDLLTFARAALGIRSYRKLKNIVIKSCFEHNPFCLGFKRNGVVVGLYAKPAADSMGLIVDYFHKNKQMMFSRYGSMKSAENLMEKRILVIGCGTLGSNLLPMLVKSGAGFRKKLTIIDPDSYQEENYCRHYLGLDALGKNKAIVMQDSLVKMSCKSNVEDCPKFEIESIDKRFQDVYENVPEFPFDIVIDTTGDESFSDYLNRFLLKQKKMPMYICSYIYGRGRSVCVSVQKDKKRACAQCVKGFVKSNGLLPELEKDERIVDSCNSVYIPFPITASISASNLTMSALMQALKWPSSEETVFWRQLCNDNIWNAMEKFEVLKDSSCVVCN